MCANDILVLTAGDLSAVFWPRSGMLGVSLQHRGVELLRRIDDLETAKAKGSTAGIPLLYPWANRLDGLRYSASGREVTLDPSSVLLHFDERGLPIHGVPWGKLAWEIDDANQDSFTAQLDWKRPELLTIFPFPHKLEMAVTIEPGALTLQITVFANAGSCVPVSFGLHPYFGISEIPRAQWRLRLPAMRKLLLDDRGIPTGAEESFGAFDDFLGDKSFDDGFAVTDGRPSFAISGAGQKITLFFLEGYTHAQVFAPKDKEFIALEPMTAPTNALSSGKGLRVVNAGDEFRAAFRITTHFNTPG